MGVAYAFKEMHRQRADGLLMRAARHFELSRSCYWQEGKGFSVTHQQVHAERGGSLPASRK